MPSSSSTKAINTGKFLEANSTKARYSESVQKREESKGSKGNRKKSVALFGECPATALIFYLLLAAAEVSTFDCCNAEKGRREGTEGEGRGPLLSLQGSSKGGLIGGIF